ncbi:deoxyguanosinetriphosphate triphosphohydrolase [Butyrivibrio sp. AE3004]|uniref:deoxyguanosinetriphosphate triphosphohydrolase n=1 Tax=Butyrivibrio sp. AE3004 TaxID=1506994 RepID=UPI000493CCA4|nr:deoxyguanosinetriphosphate triphosphohydrolase [Butyrivibrio sp. AE3004]
MEWRKLLCSDRIRPIYKHEGSKDLRSEFEKDYHRIIGSASFRRLQDKTQVFPLDQSDFVRTRLTHSLEVSSFCKSLGQNIARKIISEIGDESFEVGYQQDICDILQCAGLLHDIGNPPFGHFGETVIREWFKDNLSKLEFNLEESGNVKRKTVRDVLNPQMQNDFYNFEGNTQALRVVTKLHYLVDEHGMNLTKALLATIIKYPVSSLNVDKKSKDICCHKMGYYFADREIFRDIEYSCGLNGRRHPLTYILEAADDIAYRTADIEDSYKKRRISFDVLLRELENRCYDDGSDTEYRALIDTLKYRYEKGIEHKVSDPGEYAVQNWIIAVQGKLIYFATESFAKNYEAIMDGSFGQELLEGTEGKHIVDTLGDIAVKYAFNSEPILKIEVSANQILTYLLDRLVPAAIYYDTDKKARPIDSRMISFISDNYKKIYHIYSEGRTEDEKLYLRLLLVTDYVCGMTDSYAKRLYQELNGLT